jgi:hypothetical protein
MEMHTQSVQTQLQKNYNPITAYAVGINQLEQCFSIGQQHGVSV